MQPGYFLLDLRKVAGTKTNGEITGVLRISLFTVKAHFRAIFPILMVENRKAASAVARCVLHQP